jgi:ArsR family transcriptional regulator
MDMGSPSCAVILKVLADPTRLKIVEALFEAPRHVSEINERLHVEQSLLSHHLKVLRDAGIVSTSRDGKSVVYRLEAKVGGKVLDLGCCRLSFNR